MSRALFCGFAAAAAVVYTATPCVVVIVLTVFCIVFCVCVCVVLYVALFGWLIFFLAVFLHVFCCLSLQPFLASLFLEGLCAMLSGFIPFGVLYVHFVCLYEDCIVMGVR